MDLREVLEKRRSLLQISIDVADYQDEVDLYAELMFTQENLSQHIEMQPALVSWWSTLHRLAELELAELERDYDLWWARVYEQTYSQLKERQSTKPNINSVENTVKLDNMAEYTEWQEKLEQKRIQVAIFSDIVQWWKEKGQMLIQSAKFYQLEYDSTGMSVPKGKSSNKRAFYEERSREEQQRLKTMMSESN